MFNQYLNIYKSKAVDYENIFRPDAFAQINGKVSLLNFIQIVGHYEELRKGLSEIQYDITEIIYETDNKIHFNWKIKAKHTGVFLNFLPTQNNLDYQGATTMFITDNKIEKIYTYFNEKFVEEQILSLSDNVIKAEKVANNLNGPAKKIYQLLLSTRQNLTDSSQVLVNALRKSTLNAPDLTLVNHEAINEIKLNTSLNKTKMFLNDNDADLFVYTPKGEENNPDLPTILYLHGGGWSIGSPEGYDTSNRKLALSAHARVVCLRYRLCPEHPYPAGFDDCCTAYMNLRKLPRSNPYFINPEKIIVAGDSVGGTFTAALTLRMHDEKQPLPDGVMLLSPATDMRLENYDSYNKLTLNNIMIDQGLIGFIRGCYIQGDKWDHPYVSPMKGDLSCFPKTFLMIGEDDPLYDENFIFSEKISDLSPHPCDRLIGKGMPHHYHTFIGLADAVDEAYQRIASFINNI